MKNSVKVITTLVVVVALLSCSGNKNLTPYKGALSDLVPEKVGGFQRETAKYTVPPEILNLLKPVGDYSVSYKDSSGKEVTLAVLNFNSDKEAEYAFQKLQEHLNSLTGGARILEGGSAAKGYVQISKRMLYQTDPDEAGSIWVDGSVMFITKLDCQCSTAAASVRAFEFDFPY
jgi:hypothetical protein